MTDSIKADQLQGHLLCLGLTNSGETELLLKLKNCPTAKIFLFCSIIDFSLTSKFRINFR